MCTSCKQYDNCTIIGKEHGITFFHIEKKELLLQNEITPYAARNKCIQTIGANTGKQRIQYNRFQSYRLYRCFRFLFLPSADALLQCGEKSSLRATRYAAT